MSAPALPGDSIRQSASRSATATESAETFLAAAKIGFRSVRFPEEPGY